MDEFFAALIALEELLSRLRNTFSHASALLSTDNSGGKKTYMNSHVQPQVRLVLHYLSAFRALISVIVTRNVLLQLLGCAFDFPAKIAN